MKPVSYFVPKEYSSPKCAFAFAAGCDGTMMEDDFSLDPLEPLYDGPVAMFGSPALWPVLRAAQAEGRDYFFIDHGYFGRKSYYRITKNAYQYQQVTEASPDRWERFRREIQPWQHSGAHILVCPNSDVYCQLHGFSVDAWLHEVTTTLRAHTDREIRVRWKHTPTPIGFDLLDCWACVVYSSAAALDALIAGVPVFVMAPFAAGAGLGLSDLSQIESPIRPSGREPLFWSLAYQQWSLPEIFGGMAWRQLQEQEQTRAA